MQRDHVVHVAALFEEGLMEFLVTTHWTAPLACWLINTLAVRYRWVLNCGSPLAGEL